MKKSIPPIHETLAELERLLKAERDAQKHQRLQVRYLVLTQQLAPVAKWPGCSGVNRDTVGRRLAAYEAGGLAQLLTITKAPGKAPRVSPALRQVLRDRLAQPDGFASYRAIWQGRQQEYGLALAYKTVHKLVRYTLRGKLKGPRKSQIKTS